jgi:hypothetical protein
MPKARPLLPEAALLALFFLVDRSVEGIERVPRHAKGTRCRPKQRGRDRGAGLGDKRDGPLRALEPPGAAFDGQLAAKSWKP